MNDYKIRRDEIILETLTKGCIKWFFAFCKKCNKPRKIIRDEIHYLPYCLVCGTDHS